MSASEHAVPSIRTIAEMTHDDPMATYRDDFEKVRMALSERRRWQEVPDLLDKLDRARRCVAAASDDRQEMWIQAFSTAVQTRACAVQSEKVKKIGRELWPWLGWYDPEAVGTGRWDRLPRSQA